MIFSFSRGGCVSFLCSGCICVDVFSSLIDSDVVFGLFLTSTVSSSCVFDCFCFSFVFVSFVSFSFVVSVCFCCGASLSSSSVSFCCWSIRETGSWVQ